MYTLGVKAGNAMGGRRGGGARAGRRPPWKSRKKLFGYILGLFANFSLYGDLFTTFFSFTRGGGLFHHVEAFLLLFTPWWGPFLGLPLPYENFCERPWVM